MRVNSAFTSPFANRFVAGFNIFIVLIAIFFVGSSFRKHSDRDLWAKQVNLIIRQIGHRLLLQAGDATSHLPPVTETKEGTFLLQFERELVFNHDSLMTLSRGSLPKTDFAAGYTVTVLDCIKGDIIYGFQVNNTSPDILACSGRSQPAGYYSIEFTFPDLYENLEQKKAHIRQPTASAKVNLKQFNSKPEEIITTTSGYNVDQPAEDLKSMKVDPQSVNSTLEESKTKTSNYPLSNLVYVGLLVLLSAPLLIWRYGKSVELVPEQKQDDTIIKGSGSEVSTLGEFLFDVKGQHLSLGSEMIPLTDKECKVLELLHKNFGELVPREMLMQEVWIKEGVITSRSLDMFISKLRKKLSADLRLRITNIHGKGYRLEIGDDAVA